MKVYRNQSYGVFSCRNILYFVVFTFRYSFSRNAWQLSFTFLLMYDRQW